ncbi:MAG: hypothetical protein AB8Y71_00260 [Coxiella endosymbiont of Haemaphysalis qinghaiensis]
MYKAVVGIDLPQLLKGACERIGGGLVIAMRENGDRESWCIEKFMVH